MSSSLLEKINDIQKKFILSDSKSIKLLNHIKINLVI